MYENFFLVCKGNACKDMYFFSKNVNARHKSDLSTKVINIICVVFEKMGQFGNCLLYTHVDSDYFINFASNL